MGVEIMRQMYKVTELNKRLIVQSMFEDKESYYNFKRAVEAAIHIQKLKERGYIILENGTDVVTGDFSVAFDATTDGTLSMPRLGTGDMTVWVGFTMGNVPGTVYVDDAELKDSFKNLSYLEPQYSHAMNLF